MSLLLSASGDIASGVVEPEGIDFDGVTDYLSRSTDLVGNVDSKTFTFSCWVYGGTGSSFTLYESNNGSAWRFRVFMQGDSIAIQGYSSAGAIILNYNTSTYKIPSNTWTHLLLSFDMSDTNKRLYYVNDVNQSSTLTWTSYTNLEIDFTQVAHRVGIDLASSYKGKGRLSHLYLDYTYRDLSIEANRRIFIDENGNPA